MDNLKGVVLGVLILTFSLVIGNVVGNRVIVSLNKKTYGEMIQLADKADRPEYKISELDLGENIYDPAVKLVVEKVQNNPSGFQCSGTVISDDYVLTAAHCVVDEYGVMLKSIDIEAMPSLDGPALVVKSKPVALNHRADYALIRGDYKTFRKMKVDTSVNPSIRSQPLSCGFPWGDKPVCFNLDMQNLHSCHSTYCTGGILYPGMSGGPVFDPSTLTIFAVNSATINGGFIKLSPLVGLFTTLDIEVRE